MNNIYTRDWRWIQNMYCPQQKLVEKHREGSSIKRKMSKPMTPYQRLYEYEQLNTEWLTKLKGKLNPFALRRNMKNKLRQMYGTCNLNIDQSELGKISI